MLVHLCDLHHPRGARAPRPGGRAGVRVHQPVHPGRADALRTDARGVRPTGRARGRRVRRHLRRGRPRDRPSPRRHSAARSGRNTIRVPGAPGQHGVRPSAAHPGPSASIGRRCRSTRPSSSRSRSPRCSSPRRSRSGRAANADAKAGLTRAEHADRRGPIGAVVDLVDRSVAAYTLRSRLGLSTLTREERRLADERAAAVARADEIRMARTVAASHTSLRSGSSSLVPSGRATRCPHSPRRGPRSRSSCSQRSSAWPSSWVSSSGSGRDSTEPCFPRPGRPPISSPAPSTSPPNDQASSTD